MHRNGMLLACILLAFLVQAVPAGAAPVPLTNEGWRGTWNHCSPPNSCFSNPAPPRIQGQCNPNGTTTLRYTLSAPTITSRARTPYPGTIAETGTITFGPPFPSSGISLITTWEATFTIESSQGRVTGTKRLPRPGGQASCISDQSPSRYGYSAGAVLDYTATITQGGVQLRDTGKVENSLHESLVDNSNRESPIPNSDEGLFSGFFTSSVPVLGLALRPKLFPAAPSGPSVSRTFGTRVTYGLSVPATTTFTVQRPSAGRRIGARCVAPTEANRARPRCTRYRTLPGSFRRPSNQPGTYHLRFSGRLSGRALAPGSYRLAAVATSSAGARSSTAYAAFRIIP